MFIYLPKRKHLKNFESYFLFYQKTSFHFQDNQNLYFALSLSFPQSAIAEFIGVVYLKKFSGGYLN